MAQEKPAKKKSYPEERKEPYIRESSPKKKCSEENGAVENAIKNRTTKNWVEARRPKQIPYEKKKKKKDKQTKQKQKDTKVTVKMSRLCKAGLFFLRWITADPSPWGNFTPPTKH